MSNEDAIVAVIRRARQLIQRGWCQKMGACYLEPLLGEVVPVNILDRKATSFCLHGAIARATCDVVGVETYVEIGIAALERVQSTLPGNQDLIVYNDKLWRRKSTILRRLDIAAGGK